MMVIYFSMVKWFIKLLVVVMLYTIYFIGYKLNQILIEPSSNGAPFLVVDKEIT